MSVGVRAKFNFHAQQAREAFWRRWYCLFFNIKTQESDNFKRLIGRIGVSIQILQDATRGDKDEQKEKLPALLKNFARHYSNHQYAPDVLIPSIKTYMNAFGVDAAAEMTRDLWHIAKLSPGRKTLALVWEKIIDFIARAEDANFDGGPVENDLVRALRITGAALKSRDEAIRHIALVKFLTLMEPALIKSRYETVKEITKAVSDYLDGYPKKYLTDKLEDLQARYQSGMREFTKKVGGPQEGPF